MNTKIIEEAIATILKAMGENLEREGLKETPQRVVKSYQKIWGGYKLNPKEVVTTFHNEGYNEMVIAKKIDFYSTCEHHLLPFYGEVSIGYIPGKNIVGLSKMPRLVEIFSRRLQNQERLTKQIADTLNELIGPRGTGVIIKAEHLCLKMRGVEKQNCQVTTSAFTGLFLEDPKTRAEFIDLAK